MNFKTKHMYFKKVLVIPAIILATQEAEIRRIAVQSRPGQTV
jgi:hypothetical protein